MIGANNSDAENLSNSVISTLALATEQITGLRQLLPVSVGPVTGFAMGAAARRQRQLSWRFDYEQIIDRPEASGGIVERTRLRIRTDNSEFEEEEIT